MYAGDSIEFTPAVPGASAERTPGELLGEEYSGGVLINGHPAALDTPLRSGDQVISTVSAALPAEDEPVHHQQVQHRQRTAAEELGRLAVEQNAIAVTDKPQSCRNGNSQWRGILRVIQLVLPGEGADVVVVLRIWWDVPAGRSASRWTASA